MDKFFPAGLILCWLATSVAAAPAFPVGIWYGEGQPLDPDAMWLERASPNGDFWVQFRECRHGRATDQIQTGTWSLKGDSETIVTRSVNGRPANFRNDYKILSFDGRKQVYRLARIGFTYSSVRVDANFRLPPCGLTS